MAIRLGENALNEVRFRQRNLVEKLEVEPSIKDITYAPINNTEGFRHIVSKKVTAAIDKNIHEDNILEGIEILGIKGKLHLGSYDIYQVPNGPNTSRLEIVTIEGGTDAKITESGINDDGSRYFEVDEAEAYQNEPTKEEKIEE